MTWLNTLLSPNGFLWHLIGVVVLTVLIALGKGPAEAEWLLLAGLVGNAIGQASTSPNPTSTTTTTQHQA